jgi:hypothetical protein
MPFQMKENHWQQDHETTCNTSFCLPGGEEKVVILPIILFIALVMALSTQHAFYKSFDFFLWRVFPLTL